MAVCVAMQPDRCRAEDDAEDFARITSMREEVSLDPSIRVSSLSVFCLSVSIRHHHICASGNIAAKPVLRIDGRRRRARIRRSGALAKASRRHTVFRASIPLTFWHLDSIPLILGGGSSGAGAAEGEVRGGGAAEATEVLKDGAEEIDGRSGTPVTVPWACRAAPCTSYDGKAP